MRKVKFNCKVEICFDGNSSTQEAFVYELERLGDEWEIVINEEKSGCWDIIVYNRFFEDDDTQDLVKDDGVLIR